MMRARSSIHSPRMARWLAFVLAIVVAMFTELRPCSTFVLRSGDQLLMGRNYDWRVGSGLVLVNQRNVRKRPSYTQVGTLPSWVSRFGSITFNQYGKELPTDGMNEAGLVVTLMWLDATRYPAPDERPALGGLSWIQYQLDNCATVEEVIQTDQTVRISPNSSPLHFLVCDALGNAAAIEFLDGRMVASRGESLPVPVLTNSRYDESVQNLRQYQGFGGGLAIPTSSASLARFVRLADWLRGYQPGSDSAVDFAFDALFSVSQSSTQWTIVFDVANRQIHFKTAETPVTRVVRLDAFDYSCISFRWKFIDIDFNQEGDVSSHFQAFGEAANLDLLRRTYQIINPGIPLTDLQRQAAFPSTLRCEPAKLPGRRDRGRR